MILYRLACDSGHEFEGWFRGSADYDSSAEAGRLACPVCGSGSVSKALMAPAVSTRASATADAASTGPAPPVREAAPDRVSLATADPRRKAVLEMLREMRRAVTENAEYVGRRFPEEARKMHYGDIEHRGIYGEADAEEARALIEEGVEVHPLPVLPEDRN